MPVPVPEAVPVPVLLDGATGTELMKRGLSLGTAFGSASAAVDAPQLLAEIHEAYATTGAQVLTTATLCAHAGDPETTHALATRATRLARAAAGKCIAVAGAIGPRPASPASARAAYHELAHALVDAGCDLLLLETMIDPEHAATAVEAAFEVAAGRPIWLALACGPDARLIGGAAIDELTRVVDLGRLGALLVGCTEIDALRPALQALAPHRRDDLWLGAYPNTGTTHDGRHDPIAHAPAALVDPLVEIVRALNLDVVGGCCGTDPAFVASLRAALHPDPRTRARADARLRRAVPG